MTESEFRVVYANPSKLGDKFKAKKDETSELLQGRRYAALELTAFTDESASLSLGLRWTKR